MSELPAQLGARLEQLVRSAQREKRLPSIAAAVLRDGELVWQTAVGAADVEAEVEATPDTQYRIGSITKTFTAAAIMQLRDAGKLDLEDTLERHVEGAAHTPTIRRLLSHASGLQREMQDDSWLTLRFAPPDVILETLAEAELVLPSGARFHYSNLAFALLGIVVERVSGVPYQDYVRERLFEPVGLTRVSFDPEPTAAKGYIAQPYADGVWETIGVETRVGVLTRPAAPGRRLGVGRPAVGDCGRHLPLGCVPRGSRRVRAQVVERRGDVHRADDRRPRALAVGLRARSHADARRRPGFRGPRRLDARLHRPAPLLAEGESRGRPARERERGSDRRARGQGSGGRPSRSGPSPPRRGGSASRRPRTSSHCSESGSWRLDGSCSAGARGSSRRASTGWPTGNLPPCSSGRRTIAGASSPGRSTAKRSGSCARRTDPWSAWCWPATPSRASQAPGALPTRNAATYHLPVRTLSRLAAAFVLVAELAACGSSHRAEPYAGRLYSVAEVQRAFAQLGLELHSARRAPGLVLLVNNRRLGPQRIPSPPRIVSVAVAIRRDAAESNASLRKPHHARITRYANLTAFSRPYVLDEVRAAISALRWGMVPVKPDRRLIVLADSIGGIRLGESQREVEKAFGRGTSKQRGLVRYFGGHLLVNYWFHDGLYKRVEYLQTRWSGYRTRSGVHVGSRREALRPLYVSCASKHQCWLQAGPTPDPVGTVFTVRHGKIVEIEMGSYG